jgi:hypothetical protein
MAEKNEKRRFGIFKERKTKPGLLSPKDGEQQGDPGDPGDPDGDPDGPDSGDSH